MPVLEKIVEEVKTLNEAELQEVATYVAFLKFRAKTTLSHEVQWSSLYVEFAEEDRAMAEEGMEEYARGLEQEDSQ
jgi:hypothetical protein